MQINIFIILGVGVLVTWASEGLGGYIKYYSNIIERQITGITIVQSIGVFSRIGYFLQAFAIAWILDEKLFEGDRIQLIIYCEIMILVGLLSLCKIGMTVSKFVFTFYEKINVIDRKYGDQPCDLKLKWSCPSAVQVLAYILLYFGAFSPLYIQLIAQDYAARSIAISGIINGMSTIILISYIDIKYANQIEGDGQSILQEELMSARYVALMLLIMFQLFLLPLL